MFFISFFSIFIDSFAPCVLFCHAMSAHQFMVSSTCTYANVTVVIDVLVIVCNRTWENRVMLSLHGQLVLDIRPRCWPGLLKLTCLLFDSSTFSTLSQHLCWISTTTLSSCREGQTYVLSFLQVSTRPGCYWSQQGPYPSDAGNTWEPLAVLHMPQRHQKLHKLQLPTKNYCSME